MTGEKYTCLECGDTFQHVLYNRRSNHKLTPCCHTTNYQEND